MLVSVSVDTKFKTHASTLIDLSTRYEYQTLLSLARSCRPMVDLSVS